MDESHSLPRIPDQTLKPAEPDGHQGSSYLSLIHHTIIQCWYIKTGSTPRSYSNVHRVTHAATITHISASLPVPDGGILRLVKPTVARRR